MKKFLGILVLSLLWYNVGFAECIEGDCINGYGTYTSDGDEYVGEHKDGKGHGQGTYTFASGNKYVGEIKNDKQHGHGTFTWSNGTKYVGEWKNSKFHGQGTFTSPDGEILKGKFKNGELVKKLN